MKEKIYITRPFLPPLEEYTDLLKQIWSSKNLTNNGPFNQKFEKALAKYLKVKYVSIVNNATTGLIIAQRSLGFKGEIITTPYSFIATTHSIYWNYFKPVFADTDSLMGNLNPAKVEKAISAKTGGILAVHNYGIPGDIKGMKSVAKTYKIPIIYDAAPALGVKVNGESILNHGDLSILSFHATKIFTTFEGGAIISKTIEMKNKIDKLINFSIKNEEEIYGLGINGKINEANAAMGLLQLKYIHQNIIKRKKIFQLYSNHLKDSTNIRILKIPKHIEYNYAYFPIFFNDGLKTREKIYNKLIEQNIFCRKYWYPIITSHDIYKNYHKKDLVESKRLSNSVLCLPIYPGLSTQNINRIIDILTRS